MRNTFTLLFLLINALLFSQEKEIKKPEYVIIANNEIISKEKLNQYGELGAIKSFNKGVTQEVRDKLAEKFGDKIGDKEFITIIELLSETEIKEQKEKAKSEPIEVIEKIDDELLLHINDSAKDFTVQMIDGKKITLSHLKGKIVLLNFWATWCGPCLMEFHEIPNALLKPFKNSDFVFIPISIAEKEAIVRTKMLQLKEKGINFNVGIDPDKEIWNKYADKSIPKNFLIDKNGIIRYISIGNDENSVEKIALEIRKLLDE